MTLTPEQHLEVLRERLPLVVDRIVALMRAGLGLSGLQSHEPPRNSGPNPSPPEPEATAKGSPPR